MNLRGQCAPKDWKYVAPMLIAKFKGTLKDDCQHVEFDSTKYRCETGVEDLLEYLRVRLNITDLQIERDAFEQYFYKIKRTRGETFLKYRNDEEAAYRKLQRILK